MMPESEVRASEPPNDRKYGVAPDVMILLASCALFLWGLGDRGLWRSEGRWAQIPREMVQTGDYFHPSIGGDAYFDKPVLTYWFRIAAAKLSGGFDEWSVRLPSAVAGLLTICATMWLARRLWSAPVGWIAGAILATAWGVLFWSRTADADVENLAVIMLAVAWYWYKRDRPGFFAFLVFWLIAFIGALAKGLPAVVVSVLAILPDIVENKRWRQVLTPSHLVAALLALAVYLLPFVYASMTRTDTYQSSGLALVVRENITRFFMPFDHKGPPYLYLIAIPGLLMPWAPLFIAAVVGLVIIRKNLEAHTRWLVWASIAIFVFFTLSGSRRSYYILPVLPMAALMVGIIWAHVRDKRLDAVRWHGRNVQAVVLAIAIIGELAGPLIGGIIAPRYSFTITKELNVSMIVIGITAAVISLVVYLLSRRASSEPHRSLWPLFAGAAVLLGGFFCWQQGLLENYRTGRVFALELKSRVAGVPAEDIGFYRGASGIVLFYLDTERPVTVLGTARELSEFMKNDRPKVIITRQQTVKSALECFPPHLVRGPDLMEKAEPWMQHSEEDDLAAWFFPENAAKAASPPQLSEASNAN
jgi:4-amino-4-deoxy-L-arabinose transferase-like glycosyltransferase